MPNLGGWEFVILIGILVLLFGAKRLPDMARSIGQSARVFKGEMSGLKKDGEKGDKSAAPVADPPPAAPASLPPAAPVAPTQETPPTVQQPAPASQPGSGHAGQ